MEVASMSTGTKESDLKEEIFRRVHGMAPDDLQRVLAYVKTIAPLPPGISGTELIALLGGTLSDAEAEEMMAVIEEEFEQVNPDEW
jgi:hypothetical protein